MRITLQNPAGVSQQGFCGINHLLVRKFVMFPAAQSVWFPRKNSLCFPILTISIVANFCRVFNIKSLFSRFFPYFTSRCPIFSQNWQICSFFFYHLRPKLSVFLYMSVKTRCPCRLLSSAPGSHPESIRHCLR